jgi:23S rRNA pseudouridine955/2504/2580 synthase/23S rRNA pseudouridine1911/1915/1917 synthase
MRYETLLETDDLVAVSKPAGMLTLPDRFDLTLESLRGQLARHYGEIYTVHRIDRDTSGLVLFARHPEAQRSLTRQFEERQVEKTYLGLVSGRIPDDNGRLDQPIAEHPHVKGRMTVSKQGRYAITHFETLERIGRHSWLRIRIETGRTHQIRVHLAHAGHPIACDPLYGTGEPILLSSIKKHYKPTADDNGERPLLHRLGLHAWRLSLLDPAGQPLHLEAPPPRDLEACLRQLRRWSKA